MPNAAVVLRFNRETLNNMRECLDFPPCAVGWVLYVDDILTVGLQTRKLFEELQKEVLLRETSERILNTQE